MREWLDASEYCHLKTGALFLMKNTAYCGKQKILITLSVYTSVNITLLILVYVHTLYIQGWELISLARHKVCKSADVSIVVSICIPNNLGWNYDGSVLCFHGYSTNVFFLICPFDWVLLGVPKYRYIHHLFCQGVGQNLLSTKHHWDNLNTTRKIFCSVKNKLRLKRLCEFARNPEIKHLRLRARIRSGEVLWLS